MTNLSRKQIDASTDDVELAYWAHTTENSEGRLLLLLHGGASNHTRWSEFAALTKLSEVWNIAAPDMRGNGSSMTRSNIDITTWCADLNDILLAEKATTVVIIGHSLGAQIALHFAHRFPEKTDALILIDTIFQSSLQGRALWISRHPRLIKAAVSITLGLNRLGLRRSGFNIPDLRELDKETRKILKGAESFEEIAKRYSALGPILRNMPLANYLRQAVATVTPLPPLDKIDKPVLSLLSSGTTVGDLEVTEQEISKFTNGDMVTLNANHWPLTETPDEVRNAIEEWLAKQYPQ